MFCFKLPAQFDGTDRKVPLPHYGPVKGTSYWNYLRKHHPELFYEAQLEMPVPPIGELKALSKGKWHMVSVETDLTVEASTVCDVSGTYENDVLVEVLRDRLYLYSSYQANQQTQTNNSEFLFRTDRFSYIPFHMDFGPYNMGSSTRFIQLLKSLLRKRSLAKSRLIFGCNPTSDGMVNAVAMLGIFCMEIFQMTPNEAFRPFRHIKFRGFRDASYGPPTHEMTVQDVLGGFSFGKSMGWFDLKSFDVEDYLRLETTEFGDMNIIIPDKILAFSGPVEQVHTFLRPPIDYPVSSPALVLPVLKSKGVTCVIRLNEKQYDENHFKRGGLDFHELYFPDGSCPPVHILQKFIEIVDKAKGLVAVHCKAGLGRTGTLISCYAMLKYRAPACDFIGWIRLMRPGSVLGPQQAFVLHMESDMHQAHDRELKGPGYSGPAQSSTVSGSNRLGFIHGLRSKKQADVAINGEVGQGQRLMAKKRNK